jgi:uncharacterized protein YneF (UPF0154 family)
VWEDLLELFYAPTAVFERRRETPAFGLALIIFTVLFVALAFAFRGTMEPVFDVEMKRNMAQAMKQNPQLTPEMVEQMTAMSRKFMFVGVAIFGLLAPVILGLALWLIGKALESKAEVSQAIMVATYAMFPRLLEAILNAVQMLLLPEDSITSRFDLTLGVGRFLDVSTTSPLLLALVGRIDLFTLWITALIAIGIGVMGRISRPRAILAAVLVWLVGAIPPVWGALRAS